ncbi:MAG: AAA family ATPase [Gammaproteobacteria bacterium]|nr:AAA family ATPase [Gammaproteobacteria bacterium]MCY4200780.1 AAA family ATPase [Gammaproteobacteria bacterium]MCY4276242.1 AAA family ATPase [Gammaproteobacteria bacterium]
MSTQLHFPSLSISGFRGIRSLDLPRLGRVTLLAGKNGVGKTSVLEAVRFYASRGGSRELFDLINTREEFVLGEDEGDSVLLPDFSSLFHDFDQHSGTIVPPIQIGSTNESLNLSLRLEDADMDSESPSLFRLENPAMNLRVSVGEHSQNLPAGLLRYYDGDRRRITERHFRPTRLPAEWPDPIPFESLGPGLLGNADVARLWDAGALTETEDFAIQALRLVVGDSLERLAVVGESPRSYRSPGRRVVAKLTSSSAPIPLKRLGDGANRLLSVALALANCRNGILLIDEVENGIHYGIQPALWRMIFSAAEAANTQVIAATHSWDCIVGFATATAGSHAEGMVIRLERHEDEIVAVEYPKEDLLVAAQQRTEVR